MTEGDCSLWSLQTLGLEFRIYVSLSRHMDDCHQAAGGEQLKRVQKIIAATESYYD